MNRNLSWILLPILVLLTVMNLSAARTASARLRGPVALDDADPAAQRTLIMHDAANVRMTLSTWGELANPDQVPGYKGFEYPNGSGNDFLFSGGIWVGAMVNGAGAVSTATDGDNGTTEFWPVHIGTLPVQNEALALGDWWLSSSVADSFGGRHYVLGVRGTDDDFDWVEFMHDLNSNGLADRNHDGGFGFLLADDDGDGTVDEEIANGTDDDGDTRIDEDTDAASDANGDGDCGYDPEPQIDEDPIGDISNDHLDNDFDGLTDAADDDADGDENVGFLDDDDDGDADEDAAPFGIQEFFCVFQDSIQASFTSSPDPDGHLPLDIEVAQRSFILADTALAGVVFIEYTVRNMRATDLEGVFIAVYSDADVGAEGEGGDPAALDDHTYFEEGPRMMVMYDNPTDNDGWGPGVIAYQLVRMPVAWADLEFTYRNFERVSGGDPVTNADKYAMISSGVIDPPSVQQGDWRMLMGFGEAEGQTLAAGESFTFTMAVIGAPDTTVLREVALRTAAALAGSAATEPVAVGPDPAAGPGAFRLAQNYPNPFNAETRIVFDLPRAADVSLRLYDLTGREVRTLAQGPHRAGRHEVALEAGALASGVYFYTLDAAGHTATQKLLLLK